MIEWSGDGAITTDDAGENTGEEERLIR